MTHISTTTNGNASTETYGGQGGSVQTQLQGGGALPLTGADVFLLFAGALILLCVGALLASLVRR